MLLLACAQSPSEPPKEVVPPPAPVPPASLPAEASPKPGEDGAPGPDGATVTTLLGEAKGVHFVGDWTSGPCGGRGYARNLYFDADQHYAAVDLVAPCPKDTPCVWSGLIGYAGIWVQEGDRLKLREIAGATAQGSPHPTEFTSTAEGLLVENGCTYKKGLTVPPGYEEDSVRPKIPI